MSSVSIGCPPISKSRQKAILSPEWQAYFDNRSDANRDALISENLNAALKIAKREFKRLRGLMSLDDCESFALESLWKAVTKWKPERSPWDWFMKSRVALDIRDGLRRVQGTRRIDSKEVTLEFVDPSDFYEMVAPETEGEENAVIRGCLHEAPPPCQRRMFE